MTTPVPPRPDPSPTELPEAPPDGTRTSRRKRRWLWPLGCAAALMLGVSIGGAGETDGSAAAGDYEQVLAERDELRATLDAVDTDGGAASVDPVGDDGGHAESEAAREAAEKAAAENATRATELDERAKELDTRESDLETREAELVSRKAAATEEEEQAAANQITDGIWTVGVDIEPGTYRAVEAVPSMCYWAILRTGSNGADIIENDLPQGGFPTVTLSEGQDFENSCGVWAKQ